MATAAQQGGLSSFIWSARHFVRLEGSRSRKTGGAGLGLATAKNAAEAHGGKLTIGEAPEGGARITLKLPLFDHTAAV